jgi:HAE1 family hydrophobic/amphiphilic exporter-1
VADTQATEPAPAPKRNVPRWCIDHAPAVIAVYLALAILIVWAVFFRLPTRMMPFVDSPVVGVVARYPGLTAEEMELYVAKPIEERMVDLRNVKYIRSFSQDGMALVSVEFQYDDRDMQQALFDVQQMVDIAVADLPYDPANFKPPYVIQVDPLNMPVLTTFAQAPEWDTIKLREFLDNEVVNRLKVIEDVESVFIWGGYRRQLQVIVDRDKLAGHGISILDVKTAMDRHNISTPAGRLTEEDREARVRLDYSARSPDEVLDYPIKTVGDRTVYMRDVARVEDTHEERRSAYHYNGQPGLAVNVIQEPTASSPDVIHELHQELRAMEKAYPGVTFTDAWDYSHFVSRLLENMTHELVLAVVLTGIVVLFFLGDIRATVVAMTTIPLALGASLLMLVPMGMSLNSSTLVGLVLAIGRLVDDSIIDIHSVKRHLNMGKNPRDAAADGTMEVRLPVIVTTTMIIIGLLPLLFAGGVTQEMFVGLTWPVVYAMVWSSILSFTLTPVLCFWLLRPEDERSRGSLLDRYALRPFGKVLTRVEEFYRGALKWALRWRPVIIVLALCVIVVGAFIYGSLGYEMMPLADVGSSIGFMEMEPGTSFEATEAATYQLESIIQDVSERHGGIVEHISTRLGTEKGGTYYTGYSMGLVNSASVLLTFTDMDERDVDIWTAVDEIHDRAQAEIPGMRRIAFKVMGSDVMATARAPVDIGIYGPDLERLASYGEALLDIAHDIPGLLQPSTSWALTQPEVHINVDRAKAAELGLTPVEVARQAYYALNGGMTTEFYRLPNIRQNTILIRYEEDQRGTETDLALAQIVGKSGQTVPLSSLVELERRRGPTIIEHDMMRRYISVNGYYRKHGPDEMTLAMDLQGRAQVQLGLEPGYGTMFRGECAEMMDSLHRINNGLMIGIAMMFLLLIAQFRSFRYPFIMMLSVPLVLTGAFLSLKLAGMTISSVSVFALVILAGMDVTVSVLLVDKILSSKAEGMNTYEAILDACPIRLVPILMTTLTALAALSPIAFAPKTGIDAYQPLAVAVIGGMLLDLVLSLLFVPVCFTYAESLPEWVRDRASSLASRFRGRDTQ